MKYVSFDADEYVCKLRKVLDSQLEHALATVTDSRARAGIHAQASLFPAHECFVRVHIGLREAGHDENFIAAVAGALAGGFLAAVQMNAENIGDVTALFMKNMLAAASGRSAITAETIRIDGQPMGAA